ncbi:MAG: quinone-dependent dihydroorotate dehydrogenase [Bacteroidetes bacterium]|nr:quinone-dependent dihydroorotate dehydrogenase [Bacteroidota bacterium]HET6244566.1 quinone-dependent dihydroorotate dehydrogenase [Bacteroidia bacterium]
MLYKNLIKPLLFLLEPETAHYLVSRSLKIIFTIPGVKSLVKNRFAIEDKKLEMKLFGITFPNPVGLAAGFDKDGKMFNELSCLGFGFIEIGTVTPRPQPGNPKPRLFRLPKDEALLNRMGFNNDGAEKAAERLRKKMPGIIIGGNIGKNKDTPNEQAVNDYLQCFETLYDYVDYFVVNVSSPNTPGLRALQDKGPLTEILLKVKKASDQKRQPKPILLKIAPDLTNEQLDDIIEIIKETKTDGVIATNTTIDRRNLKTNAVFVEQLGAGGLSGKPVKVRSTEVIRYLSEKSGSAFPIIGVGGIHDAQDALEKIKAGASLIQLYTGFIYEGPILIKKINQAILKSLES